jgi:hypothetical protein
MRLAGLAVLGAVVAGKPMSCNQWAESGPTTTVSWSLPEGPGASGVELVGCLSWGSDEEGPEQVVLSPGWGSCGVRGWRKDGQLWVVSRVVPIDSTLTQQHIVFDDLPSGPIGGMGAWVQKNGASVRVEQILPGTPADRELLLRPGDRVLRVDGLPTEDMSTTDFVRAVTGPVGELVVLEVESWGEVSERTFYRERIR